MSWLGENADELAALMLIGAGIYLVLEGRFEEGAALIGIGTAYLWKGKLKEIKTPTGGLPRGQ